MKHTFVLDGQSYSGRILSDTSSKPHLYWFLFDDANMRTDFPDDLAFKRENDSLKPIRLYSNKTLVNAVQEEIEQLISQGPSSLK